MSVGADTGDVPFGEAPAEASPNEADDELDEVDDPAAVLDGLDLTTAGIAEMLPGVLPPLRWGLASQLVEEAFRRLLDGLDAWPDGTPDRRLVHRVRGRAALDFRYLTDLASALPGSVPQELEAQYFGSRRRGRLPAAADGRAHGRLRTARHDLRVTAVRGRAIADAEVVVAAVRALDADDRLATRTLGDPAAGDPASGDAALAAALLRLIDLAARATAAELAVAADAAALYRRLEVTLGRRLDPVAAGRSAGLLTAHVAAPPTSPRASAAVFAGPTWEELGRSPGPARRDAAPGDGELPAAVWDEVRAMLADAGALRSGSWRDRFLLRTIRRLAGETTAQLTRREATKAAVLAIGGHTRRLVVRTGEHLAGTGRLPTAADVELLLPAELFAVLRGAAPPATTVLDRRRLALRRAEAMGPLPIRFSGRPPATTPATGPDGGAGRPGGGQLEGWAAGPGRAEGIARVVHDPTDPFEDDEVLVAVVTDPSWTPLFERAGAVVLERGGPLSHAAVLAREFGLPAVLDVAGATATLDGRRVLVDGDHGIVTIVADTP